MENQQNAVMANVKSNPPILKIEVNNVKSRILYDSEIYNDYFIYCLDLIDKALSFHVPNYENNKDYNTILPDGTRKWDGKIHLFNPYPHTKYYLQPFEFLTGKIYEVITMLYQMGYKIELIDHRIWYPRDENKWVWNDNFPPYQYQEDTANIAVKEGRGIILAATSSGKTNIAARIIQKIGLSPTLFFVTTRELLEQAKERIESLLGVEVGKVGDGHCNIKDITICTIQTCFMAFGRQDEYKKQLKTLGSEFSVEKEKEIPKDKYQQIQELIKEAKTIIMDEAHHAASDTCKIILDLCEKATYRFGLSATVKRDDGMEKVIEGLFGKYLSNISISYIIERGQALAPEIYLLPVETPLGLCENYQSEYKAYITENKIRNEMIAQIAAECVLAGKSTLVLVKFIPHGENLRELIKEKVESMGGKSEDVIFMHGKMKDKLRTETMQKLKNKEIKCCIATSLADEGLDVPCLEILIMAVGGKSFTKTIQRVGRVVRKDKKNPNKVPVVFDFIEDRQAKFLRKHSIIRKKIYESEPAFKVIDLRKNIKKQSWGLLDEND